MEENKPPESPLTNEAENHATPEPEVPASAADAPTGNEDFRVHDMTDGKPKKNRKTLFIAIGAILFLLIAFGIFLFVKTDKAAAPASSAEPAKVAAISTYEECIQQKEAQILDTKPGKCIYNGFTYNQTVADKSAADTPPKVVDPIADWKSFTAKNSSFTVKYPKDYLTRDCSDDGNAAYFGSSEDLLAICNSGKTGQIYFGAVPKGEFTMASLKRPANATYEKDYKYEDATVDSKAMIKTTSTLKAGEMTEEGTKIVTYDYVAGSVHFSAAYQQKPSEADNLATFEQMVKTWVIK